ncbi:MAG: LLM class flavin-dependent oxidoreductase, partial [Anaerolineae bacterium]|nr:LLM class flavin-dependent oxidoreductase [Anaerolineae bacterium]
PSHDDRVAMLAEGVEIIRLLWSGEPVTYGGRWYRLEGAQLEPVPAQRRLGIGGNSDATLRLAASCADEWSTTGRDTATLRERNDRLDALACEAGRSPRDIERTLMDGVLVGRDEQELERRARRMQELVPQLRGKPWPEVVRQLADEWGWWVGTPQEIAGQAAEGLQAGFDRLFFQVYDAADVAAMRLLADEVIPALRASAQPPASPAR